MHVEYVALIQAKPGPGNFRLPTRDLLTEGLDWGVCSRCGTHELCCGGAESILGLRNRLNDTGPHRRVDQGVTYVVDCAVRARTWQTLLLIEVVVVRLVRAEAVPFVSAHNERFYANLSESRSNFVCVW